MKMIQKKESERIFAYIINKISSDKNFKEDYFKSSFENKRKLLYSLYKIPEKENKKRLKKK